MKNSTTGIRRKGGQTTPIKPLDLYPEEPGRKDLVAILLASLQGAKEHYENQFLALDKKTIPREFLNIFWGLRNEVCDFLERYEIVQTATKSGKSIGRNKIVEAMEIANEVVAEFKSLNSTKDAWPTGKYLFENINSRINEMALRGEPCPMNVSLRTCQEWLKKIKGGNFP